MKINKQYITDFLLQKFKKPIKFEFNSVEELVDYYRKNNNSYPYQYDYPCINCEGKGFLYDSWHDEYFPCPECNKNTYSEYEYRDHGEGSSTLESYIEFFKTRTDFSLKVINEYNQNIANINSMLTKLTDEELLTIYELSN